MPSVRTRDDSRRRKGRRLCCRPIIRNDIILGTAKDQGWDGQRGARVDAVDDALVCRRKVAAKHDGKLKRASRDVRQVCHGVRRTLRVAEDALEGSLLGEDGVEQLVRIDVPVGVRCRIALAAGRVRKPQVAAVRPARKDILVSRGAARELREHRLEGAGGLVASVEAEHLRPPSHHCWQHHAEQGRPHGGGEAGHGFRC